MFKLFFVVASFLAANTASESLRGSAFYVDEGDDWMHFIKFQSRFSKVYSSSEEVATRFEIFRQNLRNIVFHNLDADQNFTMGINKFSDMTNEEFRANVLGGFKNELLGSYGCKSYSSSASGAPVSIDWRNKNAVTSVKDQGNCGSCWTFSSTGAVEGAWAIAKGQLVDLSEEQLVECATGVSYGSHGCNGGQMEGAFKYIIEHGQCSNAVYPYTSGNGQSGSCKSCSAVAHISSCSDVKPNDQISLKGAVAMQPVSVAIDAGSMYFQSYSSGVLTDKTKCGTSLNHGVLAVGYGEENGNKYWLVKNSWSTQWGDKGYVKIGRSESANDAGVCGIAMQPSFPTV